MMTKQWLLKGVCTFERVTGHAYLRAGTATSHGAIRLIWQELSGVWNELWNERASECGRNAFLHPGTEATTYYKPTAYDTNPVVRAHVTALISSTLLLPSFEETNYCQLTSTSRVENKTHSSGVELHH